MACTREVYSAKISLNKHFFAKLNRSNKIMLLFKDPVFQKTFLGHSGMLTLLTNIRSTMVLWLVEDVLQWKTTFVLRCLKCVKLGFFWGFWKNISWDFSVCFKCVSNISKHVLSQFIAYFIGTWLSDQDGLMILKRLWRVIKHVEIFNQLKLS